MVAITSPVVISSWIIHIPRVIAMTGKHFSWRLPKQIVVDLHNGWSQDDTTVEEVAKRLVVVTAV
jgi:hypothetical protein